ncbi:sigma-70 family RNA polymerase sigma factor [Trichothermofontia sp.]
MSSSSKQPSDVELVQRCLQGRPAAFRQLYRRYQQRVRSTLYQLCGAAGLDDLVQEVFLKAWKGLPNLKQPAQFSQWLYRIAWNVAMDQRRTYARDRSHLQVLGELLDDPPPDTALTRLHYADLVQQGLAQLSLEHRAVLVLHDLEDIPQKEVASILEIPVGTVKSRLFHARAQMRQFLQQQGVQL